MSLGKIGWGGRIRTSTILINSEVSYRLDHAPAGGNPQDCRETLAVGGLGRSKMRARLNSRYHECAETREAGAQIKSNKNCIEPRRWVINILLFFYRDSTEKSLIRENAERHSGLLLMHIAKTAASLPQILKSSIKNLFSKFAKEKFPEKVSA